MSNRSPNQDSLVHSLSLGQASVAATTGGLASISVSAEGFSTSLDLDVWYPSPISLHLDDTTLSLIEGCDPTGNAASNGDGNTLYQSTRLRVLAGTPSLDVTPLLGTASEAASRISLPPNNIAVLEATTSPQDGRVARLHLRGVATGYGSVHLVHSAHVSEFLFVSQTPVTVDALFVGALSAASTELRLTPAGALSPRASPPTNEPLTT